ncbi:MAG TPA: hypothetical protein VFT76_00105 [Actinomycetota bacterium]|nr:hypothetical protein [Actinomycetota bacterium]
MPGRIGRRGVREELYPSLPRCEECGHVLPKNPDRLDLEAHWPKCSKADPDARARWARRDELRKLRTIGRVGDPIYPPEAGSPRTGGPEAPSSGEPAGDFRRREDVDAEIYVENRAIAEIERRIE